MSDPRERIGLVAGTGSLAVEFASRARERGCEVVVVALSASDLDSLSDIATSSAHFSPLQPKKIMAFFHSEGVRRVGFAGKVEKNLLFQGLKFDFEALRFMYRVKNLADITIMDEVLEFVGKNNLEVIPQTEFLDHLLAPEGQFGKFPIPAGEEGEVRYAFQMAREIARLDIGQTLVAKKGAVVAVEAMEGTDETIRRGCALAGTGAVVCKVARPDQDARYDIPTVGPATLKVVKEGGASILVVEAGATFLIDKEALIKDADAAGIALAGWRSEEEK
ncbi:MAG: UDP-2,3-diacylglucosamine diphosphatase LpxI [Nitrospinaceae bacterium]|jgi:UDP-2,3-diacylglucosamine hydrolase|nr:UDP-2,3-diacylglucosamine diphosphatase LpxI [Nitrospinaceae bacterium]MBT3434907.1 UDP-2,3-diacylglucosamine diphosphatase LpxI [Nitrospinaceae bacterium]MBT4093961.1 UDP-2,3-diacylglucosamine diphosphatase LpxI [Nitrospinaceae bacterium]MBT4431055.1 UDP-2,3-diacylglucosamine diphosphatase LpxI [Nitrospinaceae bacterium]MBT5367673.1 UDP-2,3-diacylglucosamine diphosphatase LpxI [Nitrospinaceae bacterium]